MAFDEHIADRIRGLLVDERDVTERRMFGGVAFVIAGNMAVSASSRGGVMVRVDHGDADALTRSTPARPMEMRGRPMRGWLHVEASDVGSDDDLATWVAIGTRCARSLPPKH